MRAILPFTVLVAFCAATAGCDSPFGSRTPATPIVYVGSPDATISGADLYLMSEDGRVRERVTEIGGTMHPHWSPDGRRIAFTRTEGLEDRRIWVVDVATGAVQPITEGSERAMHPAWSPDGTRIAYRSGGDFVIADADGSNRVRFPVPWIADGPAWSVDGTRILYGDRRRLWAVDLDGENPTALTSDEGFLCSPALSPTGDRIAYIRCEEGHMGKKVVVIDLAGSARQEIEIDAFSRVSWAPDGHRLVVDVNRSGTPAADILLVDLRSGTRTTLTRGPDIIHMGPHWRPQ
jgi:TolB protein